MTENIGEWLLYPPPPLYTVTKMVQYYLAGGGYFLNLLVKCDVT